MQQKKKVKSTYHDCPDFQEGPSYAEELELVQSFYDQIKPSMANEENRIRNTVSSAVRIPVEIVDELLCFSEYINKKVLKTLAELKVNKHFFDRAQKVKRQLVKIYRHDELSEAKITSKISKAVFEMYREYLEKGNINTKDWQRFIRVETEIKNRQRKFELSSNPKIKTKKFKYWSGAKELSEVQPITMNEINKTLDVVHEKIGKINVLDNRNLKFHAGNIRKEILRLAKVRQQILKIDHFKGCDQYEEAA